MKKIIALALAALLACTLVLGGCAGKVDRLEQIKKDGKITMLTNAAFPPYEYINGSVVAGVDAEVAQAIAADLGVELEIIDMNFDLLIDALKSGKGDMVLAGLSIKPDRLEQVDMSTEYVKSYQRVIIKTGSGITADKLEGLTIAVQESTTGDFLTDELNPKEVLRFKSGVEAGAALASGKCDVVIIDELPATAIAANYPGVLEVLPDDISEQEKYAVAVQKDQKPLLDAINATLERLMADGTIDELIIKHMAAK